MTLDTPESAERRLRNAMQRIKSPHAPFWAWAWRAASIAAAAMVVLAMIVFGSHTGASASAMVHASIKASHTAGDRRYEVRVIPVGQSDPAELPRCTVDVRDPDHFVIKARGVFHGPITMGRDEKGDWAIKREGQIDRQPPRQLLEEWMVFGRGTVTFMAVDDFLGSLEETYHLSKGARQRAPFAGGALGAGPLCDRITATPTARADEPERVEIWLDAHSHIVQRIELHWPDSGKPVVEMEAPPPRRGGRTPPGNRPARGAENPVVRVITFQLIETPALDASWFNPASHAVPASRGP